MYFRSLIAVMLFAVPVAADWQVQAVDPSAYPPEILSENRARVQSISDAGLPDGLVAKGTRDIAAAWYEGPTRRYAHAILGDAVEAGSLVVETATGDRLMLDLPVEEVFEDRYPRLADLDQDGRDEVITIRSSRSGGGGVAVYGIQNGLLVERAHVAPIGLSNRWLNIAGVADFHPRAGLEIAFVKTPHIGGTLRLFGWGEGVLPLIDEKFGYSNHAIGSPEMRLSALTDLTGDGYADMALPSANRRALKIVTFAAGIDDIATVDLEGRIDKAIASDADAFIAGTRSGKVYRVTRAR